MSYFFSTSLPQTIYYMYRNYYRPSSDPLDSRIFNILINRLPIYFLTIHFNFPSFLFFSPSRHSHLISSLITRKPDRYPRPLLFCFRFPARMLHDHTYHAHSRSLDNDNTVPSTVPTRLRTIAISTSPIPLHRRCLHGHHVSGKSSRHEKKKEKPTLVHAHSYIRLEIVSCCSNPRRDVSARSNRL